MRVKPPSIRTNRILYIVIFGIFFGGIIWMFLYATGIVRLMIDLIAPNENTAIGLSLVVSFGIGAILGDLFGRYRNYRGPAKYSP